MPLPLPSLPGLGLEHCTHWVAAEAINKALDHGEKVGIYTLVLQWEPIMAHWDGSAQFLLW
jgi:hypothetical protein